VDGNPPLARLILATLSLRRSRTVGTNDKQHVEMGTAAYIKSQHLANKQKGTQAYQLASMRPNPRAHMRNRPPTADN